MVRFFAIFGAEHPFSFGLLNRTPNQARAVLQLKNLIQRPAQRGNAGAYFKLSP
jgi:hypothetical protein